MYYNDPEIPVTDLCAFLGALQRTGRPLVLFNEVLDRDLQTDRIFRQLQGTLLLSGTSGARKSALSHFVAWMNGLCCQVNVHDKYTAQDFDDDLRGVLRRA